MFGFYAPTFCNYTNWKRCNPIEGWSIEKEDDLVRILDEQNVKIITVHDTLFYDFPDKHRAYIENLIEAPQEFGYRLHAELPEFKIYVSQ